MDSEETDEDARDALWRRIRTEGVELAYATAVNICRDPKAPAPAKATALTALFRIAGFFEISDAGETKQLHEMDAAELDQELRRVRRMLHTSETAESNVFD